MTRMMITMLAAAALLCGCVASDDVSRSVNPITESSQFNTVDSNLPKVMVGQYSVQAVNVSVPRSLRVSEANMFYPIADIVWRGDVRGDRHAQIKSIFDEAAAKVSAVMTQGQAAIVDVEVLRFHSVTEKTRYTVGGVHDVKYILTVRDAQSSAILDGPRKVHAEVKAAGGAQAVAEEQAGRTMRVVIVERLVNSLRAELSAQVTDQLLVSQALGNAPSEFQASTN